MNVLIIGGTGLISTGIVKALKERGAAITVFNRGKTDDRLGGEVRHLTGDRRDFSAFEKAMADAGTWDVVIDMICFRPDEAESVLRAFAGRCGHFIFCSTVCTYGNTQTIVPTLETTPQSPHSTYGRDKLACEQLFLRAHASGKMPVTIIRPSHTYGPGGGIINNLNTDATFLERLRQGRPIIVSGDGHGLWQSAYADDVGRGFAFAAANRRCFGETYNAVADEVVTWDQYVQRTAAAIGAPVPRIVHLPTDFLLAVDPKRYVVLDEIFRFHGVYSNAKLKRDVPEFRLTTPYEEGVRRTAAWMDLHGKNPSPETNSVEDRLVAAWEQFSLATVKAFASGK
ncbi:MAG TPA: NAD-dependent epimerase/dehydratase family protein [Opitutaceae bacterium]|nr:NAD-dependent epimerase/dehydratase family protein [Opitutaceae bacterium]